ncbi:MAG: SOS response-associated peptidase [Saprospiraceae bacterium]|jgi:putative SOS response-associated peptidase YedK|nr:SOS response-associated peptidase [Saprospiraceae bacterium]MDP4997970.1 SOS response-associated peptidase [Saprospiraceae bacterium]
MCGRFSFVASKEKIEKQLGGIEVENNLRTSFNIAPTQHAYVVTDDSPKRLQYLVWGLIPHWSRDGSNSGKLINARKEGILTKPSFRLPIRNRRCLVLADSFYEWRKVGTQKIPYRIALKSEEIILMAGIWDVWYKGDYAIKSFSIITTPPNLEVSGVHNRMPVIFTDRARQKQWLEEEDMSQVVDLLQTPDDGLFKIERVSDKVNSIANNSPELHQSVQDLPGLFD